MVLLFGQLLSLANKNYQNLNQQCLICEHQIRLFVSLVLILISIANKNVYNKA